MSIRRGPRPTGDFYILDKKISEDPRLSWGARGLLVYLLGKPDNWSVSVAQLVNETQGCRKPSGRDAVYSFLKELETFGYISRSDSRSKAGKFSGADYIVTENPLELTASGLSAHG